MLNEQYLGKLAGDIVSDCDNDPIFTWYFVTYDFSPAPMLLGIQHSTVGISVR